MTIDDKRTARQFNLYINDKKIYRVNEIKYLGVNVDDQLKWDAYIRHQEKKNGTCLLSNIWTKKV